ncbi:hypothetical protein ACFWXK_00945 [Streptomyces sp. NPDC059070]|uniref:hypothetical protein n=1 Tax=Streptomyces sp. NPDC059070 TaxID=3346713 RepID=UPI003684C297
MSRLRHLADVGWPEARHLRCLVAMVLTWVAPCVCSLRTEATEPVDLIARLPAVSMPDLSGLNE